LTALWGGKSERDAKEGNSAAKKREGWRQISIDRRRMGNGM